MMSNSLKVSIPEDCKKIIVLFSGGVDSTLLLFLLMKERQETGRKLPIKCYTMNIASGDSTYLTTLKWISDYFNEEIPIQSMRRLYIREAISNIFLIDSGYVYTGCNLVLEDEIKPTVYLRGDTPPKRGPAFNEFHLRPFIDLPKDIIIQQYKELDILDLLKLTVSCGVPDGPCGGCYFCLERKWGLQRVGLVETL